MAHDSTGSLHASPIGEALPVPDFRLIVDSIPALLATMKANGEVEWCNRQVREYFNLPFDELAAWQVSGAVHPEDVPHTIAAWQAGIASGSFFEYEHRLRRFDGVHRWFHFRALPLRDENGELVRWYSALVDIDDVKRAHEALRASATGLRLLIDSIPALVYTMTPTCELEIVNRQVLEYFGRTLEELRHWDTIGSVHPDDMSRVAESLRRTVEFEEPHEVEQRLRRADGTYRWFKPGALPLRDSQGRIVRWYCLLTDIDDLKRAEEGLRNVQARFSRAAHLATISELAASIAHEINQPIAAMSASAHACLQWLAAAPPNLERARLSAERVARDCDSAAEVVTRIRALFQHAPPVKEVLNVNDVIEEVCALVAEDLSRRSVVLRPDLQADLPSTAADRVQLQQLLANLVRNAAEAMDDVHERTRELSISSRQMGDEITVHVTDCGVGLSAPEAVFDAFYTTKPNGMGMGLAICRTITEAHDGRLWAMPNAPHGTTFAFALRISAENS
jgi:PAS domain S-box-containing protein